MSDLCRSLYDTDNGGSHPPFLFLNNEHKTSILEEVGDLAFTLWDLCYILEGAKNRENY